MYYNTTNIADAALKQEWRKTEKQEDVVLALFEKHNRMTASECWRRYGTTTPLTSIRRAITDLTNEGKLVKTSNKKPGIYGKPEYEYQLYFTEKLF